MGRKIAIIGTAGRDKNHPMSAKHWDFMCEMVRAELNPDDHLISGGAAKYARLHHGAVMGQGMGLQGTSYALPTKGVNLSFMSLSDIGRHVMAFISFAKIRPDLTFRVTRVGCGLAGFTDEDIAPMFKEALPLKNIRLPKGWRHLIQTGENIGISDDAEELSTPELYADQELWEADPNCVHDIQAQPSGGIKCTKCRGWFCY